MIRDIPAGTEVDGRYRVISRIGAGGMADVYCAEDLQLGRNVALKLLHRRFAEDQEFVERFRREASSAAGLQHPNVVGVFDRGEWDGTSYIAMELLEGRSLKALIGEEGALDPIRAIDVAVQVLRAARFAHRRGIIHRDLKPQNVMVDDDGRAKVADFGIARAGASDMTQTGSIMGTAQYLSPEQAQGEPVTPRSDLYSVGILLYEMLTGRLPFDGESAVTIALKQVGEAPVPPSAYNDAVTPELEGVVLQALEKDPALRFADADAFILALDRARGHLAAGLGPGGGAVATTAFPATDPTALAVPAAVAAPYATGEEAAIYPTDAYVAQEAAARESRRFWLAALALVLVAGIALGGYLLLRPEKRTVPDATGRPVAAALASLRNAGFAPRVQRVNASAPRGQVIRQDPEPRAQVDKGAAVTLTVSDGPARRTVPTVTGDRVAAASRALKRAGFKVREKREASDSVPAGQVISTSPDAGRSVPVGATVTLTVSTGQAQVQVPGVTGDTRAAARTALEGAGLAVAVVEKESDEASGTVLGQDPGAAATVAPGTTITITVAKAPADAEVPDVTGRQETDAVNALVDAGFRPRSVPTDVPNASGDGVVQKQSPSGGGRAKKGARVTITVGRFSPKVNPEPDTTTPTTPSGGGNGSGGAGATTTTP